MPNIMKKDAEEIAAKLNREQPIRPGRVRFRVTIESKRANHDIVKVYYRETFVGQYGIQRASREKRHNYVAEQLHLSRTQGVSLAKCPLSVDDYLDILLETGEIPVSSA